MQFSSGAFLMIFLPLSMAIYKICLGVQRKNLVLLISSIVFYAWGEPVFIFILLIGIFVNYLFGLGIERANRTYGKAILTGAIVFNIGILFIFKYLSFVLENLNYIIDVSVIDIALPIGISFYTFQIMSYVFDVYYEKVPAQHSLLNLALYISMFPQLVAGPIVRYSDIEKEIVSRNETLEEFCNGVYRFIIGLAKKVLIADYLGGVADKIFVTAEYSCVPTITAWIGAAAYTFEIYYDFSGYSDMAIGLGWCFGFHFMENFNYPYISKSISEFWRRWHISLTSWFRDYIYIPLGGNRVSAKRHVFNILIVWLLTGIWHGAEWTFIIWGLIYCAIQLIEKKTEINKKIPAALGYIYTMLIIMFCWVIFKSTNVKYAWSYIKIMLGVGKKYYDTDTKLYLKSSMVVLIIAYVGSFPWLKTVRKSVEEKCIFENTFAAIEAVSLIMLLVISLLAIINGSYSPFIYFNF